MSEKDKKTKGNEADLIAQAVKHQAANKRRCTAKMKTRAEVSGGGAKPWRQKGTGRARHGSTRSPIWVGGGRAFGSSQSNYEQKMNRKARQKAMALVLGEIKAAGRLVVAALKLEKPSTKAFMKFMKDNGVEGKAVVLYEKGYDENVILSARNIEGVKTLNASCINMHDLLKADWLMVSPEDADLVESRIASIGG